MTEEQIDVLDENEGFTGEIIGRDEAHKTGAWHRAVALYIVNSKNQVLLQKRSKHKKTWAGCWDMTCGGHAEAGSFGLITVIREADEELGITLCEKDICYMCGYRSNNKHGKIWDRHFNEYYIAFKDVDTKDLKIQEGEVDEVKWVSYKKFKKMVECEDKSLTSKWEAHKAFVRFFDNYSSLQISKNRL